MSSQPPGTGKEELLFESPLQKPADWSGDGRLVIYPEFGSETGQDVCVPPNPLGDAVSRKPYAFLATEAGGRLSPNGKYLAYTPDESHTFQVYVQSFPGKERKFQISTGGGTRPVWSRDGKELFYIAPDGKMMAVDVNTGDRFEHSGPKPLFETRTQLTRGFAISPDGKRFLMVQQGGNSGGTSLSVVLNWHAVVKK